MAFKYIIFSSIQITVTRKSYQNSPSSSNTRLSLFLSSADNRFHSSDLEICQTHLLCYHQVSCNKWYITFLSFNILSSDCHLSLQGPLHSELFPCGFRRRINFASGIPRNEGKVTCVGERDKGISVFFFLQHAENIRNVLFSNNGLDKLVQSKRNRKKFLFHLPQFRLMRRSYPISCLECEQGLSRLSFVNKGEYNFISDISNLNHAQRARPFSERYLGNTSNWIRVPSY